MNKPRIKIRPDAKIKGVFWIIPKTASFWTVQATPWALRDLHAFADMLERIGAHLVLRNLRDSIILN